MKIKKGFILRDVGGKTYVVAVGELSKTFNGMVTLNETGKFLWQELEKGATKEELLVKMLSEFEGAEEETVKQDIDMFISKLEKDKVLEQD
ncbi:MAG: PqqD family protein [Clostridia bacterium]|nr:PqqD family protein [Clostridia bacterium]